MASHYKWYPPSEEVVVPWSARYSFPSQANKAVKITPRIPPKTGFQFNPGNVIRVEFPAQGYVNPLNTMLEFDLTLQGFTDGTPDGPWSQCPAPLAVGGGSNPVENDPPGTLWPESPYQQTVRLQNNVQSCFQRVRLMYGATPLEDIINYNVVVRGLTEWTACDDFSQTSISEGIGGVAYSSLVCSGAPGGQATQYVAQNGLLNVRQAFIQGIDSTPSAWNQRGVAPNIAILPVQFQGAGLVPDKGAAGATGISTRSVLCCTRRYMVNFALGMFTQDKLLPVKFMASQLAVEITLAPEVSCIYVAQAPSLVTGSPTGYVAPSVLPTYTLSNINLIPEILEFDASYDLEFINGLSRGGVPIKFSSWHTFIFPVSSTNLQLLIQERSRSVKALFAIQRRQPETLYTDSGTFFFDTSGGSQSAGCLQQYQFRIGGRYFPAAPVQCATTPGSGTSNGGAEAFVELQKALNVVGDYRLKTSNNAIRWAVGQGNPSSNGPISAVSNERDFEIFWSGFDSQSGNFGAPVAISPAAQTNVFPFAGNMGSTAFAMATDLETSNGLEISGLNAEEQSDISLLATFSAAQNPSFYIEVYSYYDAMIVLRENNVLGKLRHYYTYSRIDPVTWTKSVAAC